jgi:hypothetical protein
MTGSELAKAILTKRPDFSIIIATGYAELPEGLLKPCPGSRNRSFRMALRMRPQTWLASPRSDEQLLSICRVQIHVDCKLVPILSTYPWRSGRPSPARLGPFRS